VGGGEALSFLRTNAALKTLDKVFEKDVTESHDTTAIRMEVAAALRENEWLEMLSLLSDDVRFADCLVFIDAIQPNTTLKSFRLHTDVDDDEMKDRIPILKKTYL
jgi:hypothetical protein